MKRIALPAVITAILGPIQSVSGWMISGALWPGFDPIKKTISDLAADDSPVQAIQSSFFILGGTLSIIAAIYARTLALPGRITIFAGGLATYGLTYFTTPSQDGYSWPHRYFAIASFILFSIWPLLSMRLDKNYPWILRPWGSVLSTAVMGVIAGWFLLTWLDPNATTTGLVERVIATAQTGYLSLVILLCWFQQRRLKA